MPKFEVTLNEIIARTYKVEADDPEDAIQVAKDLLNPEDHLIDQEWVDYWGEAEESEDVVLADSLVTSPSGWDFRESQENGDEVSCAGCGNRLNDDYPIVNDDKGYAYHEGCLEDEDDR